MLKIKRGKDIIEYPYVIKPIKKGKVFKPNIATLNLLESTGKINILRTDFVKYQEKGETIIVNHRGGWCTLSDEDEIVSDEIKAPAIMVGKKNCINDMTIYIDIRLPEITSALSREFADENYESMLTILKRLKGITKDMEDMTKELNYLKKK